MHGIMPRKSLTSSDSKAIVPELKMVVHTQVNHHLCSRGLRKTPRQMDEVFENNKLIKIKTEVALNASLFHEFSSIIIEIKNIFYSCNIHESEFVLFNPDYNCVTLTGIYIGYSL